MKRIVKTPFPQDPLLFDPAHLGAAVRAARTEQGLTIETAALLIGVAKQTLSDIELGRPTVGIGIVMKVLKEMGITLSIVQSRNSEPIREHLRSVIEDAQ